MSKSIDIIKSRPAETAMPIAVVIAGLIGKLAGVEDTDTIFYLALVLSFVPAAVTWIVELVKRKPDTDATTLQRTNKRSSK
jgi:hypothetical protein